MSTSDLKSFAEVVGKGASGQSLIVLLSVFPAFHGKIMKPMHRIRKLLRCRDDCVKGAASDLSLGGLWMHFPHRLEQFFRPHFRPRQFNNRVRNLLNLGHRRFPVISGDLQRHVAVIIKYVAQNAKKKPQLLPRQLYEAKP